MKLDEFLKFRLDFERISIANILFHIMSSLFEILAECNQKLTNARKKATFDVVHMSQIIEMYGQNGHCGQVIEGCLPIIWISAGEKS